MKIRVEKLLLFDKLINQGIKPNSEKFQACVISLLKDKIAEEIDLKFVGPDTFTKVETDAQKWSSLMRIQYTTVST